MVNLVGGGPAGLFAAANLAAKGLDVTLFEEDTEIGKPVHCTGLVSTRIDSIIKLSPSIILNRVKGARLFSKNETAEISRGKTEAYVIDRARFDAELGELARRAGADIMLGTRADPFALKGPTIIAEGAASQTLGKLGLKLRTLPAPQWIVQDHFDADFVELHFLRPDFFAWVVPENETTARVGIAASSGAVPLLESFLAKRLPNGKVIEKQSGLVNVNGPLRQTVFGDKILLGDCAGQTKATTGGGIITGMMCAQLLASNFGDLAEYERAWHAHPGGELRTALMIRNFLSKLNEKGYDKLVALAKKNQNIISDHGDMDFHGKMTRAFLRKPSNWPAVARLLAARYLF